MKNVAILAAALLLGACASQSYSDLPVAMQGVAASGTIAVAVHDQRPYITSKQKEESFAGLQRGGYGNPFDLKTPNNTPLAAEMRDSLVKALKARGANAVPVAASPFEPTSAVRTKVLATKARRSALVVLREWKTDTQMRTDFSYDTTVHVLDEGGRELASHTVKGLDALGFSQAGGETITKATAAKLDALFSEPKVAAALR
jgi:hypothetical protein